MIWGGLGVMIAVIIASAACLRSDRGDALGIPLVAIGTFTFLYVIQPLQLMWSGTLKLFLTDWQATKALLVSALMLTCFMWGWQHHGRRKPIAGKYWNPRPLWWVGIGSACMGLILYLIFLQRSGGILQAFAQAHGRAMAWNENTAYLYDGPWLMLSGAVMMIFGDPRTRRQRWKTVVPYAFIAVYFVNAILGGDRGPMFAGVSAAFVATSITRSWRVSLRQAGNLLIPLGCVIAIVFGYREVIHLGPETPKSLPTMTDAFNSLAGTSEYDQERGTAAQEFLYHAATLATVDQTLKLEWGESWIEFFFVNPIPRVLWPEKKNPEWHGVSADDIKEHTGIAIAPGAAPGIVADIYDRFQFLSVFFFFALGRGLRRLLILASNMSSPLTTVGYVMIYAVSLNMFAQGFGAIFVPFCYSMAPVAVFAWFARRNRQRAMVRARKRALQQLAVMGRSQWS